MITEVLKKLADILNKERDFEIHTKQVLTAEEYDEIKKVITTPIIKNVIDPNISQGFKIKYSDVEIDLTLDQKADNFEKFILEDLKSTESIVDHLRSKIQKYKGTIESQEVGEITSIKDCVIEVNGVDKCLNSELLELPSGDFALALNLNKDSVGAVVLGEFIDLKVGDKVKRTGRVLSIPVGDNLIGRVLNPLAEAVDGKVLEKSNVYYPVDKVAPGVMTRQPVDTPLQTGITSIDALVPIGRGQRELILGDRQTGKTTIAIDTILNQKGKNVICIYVAIGQKESKIARLNETLQEKGAMDYTIIVNASASDPASLQYLAPYSGTAIGEYFLDQGKDVLIIYDDLSKHAVAYRELSLILRRPPGREAYPGDVFYLHSRLLERACRLNEENGGGSITALPIIETQAGDISSYIPTNVISITDGQIFLETDLFYKGVRPAINVGLSVSRVGSAAQTKPIKKVAGKLKLTLAQFRELEAFSQFASDVDQSTREQIDRGYRTIEILKQKNGQPQSVIEQAVAIFAVNNGVFDQVAVEAVDGYKQELVKYIQSTKPELVNKITGNQWDDSIEEELLKIFEEFKSLSNTGN
jgi:F-type H+-transporting ATPase subunit alpha